ncbi:MAG: V/A-type H+/Na+-transporting ATPase subunit [Candidatus Atribacteria bacterium]|jgi:vacuolar-type H+-ATPase subunit E/Vma4|nr:V/A-type H+/Na+-transporting ATPase subunit [Candidatus Atribacteria bacterium]
MPLEDILKKIEEEAELKKKRILEEARAKASAQLERAQKEIEEEAEQLLSKRRREIELEVQRKIAEARLTGKNEIGKVKYNVWEKLHQELVEAFIKKVEAKEEEWCRDFLVSQVVSGDEEVWMAPREAEILGNGFLKKLNQEKGFSLRFGGVAKDLERGFLLKRGGMVVDLSFISVVEDYIRKNEGKISALLFED